MGVKLVVFITVHILILGHFFMLQVKAGVLSGVGNAAWRGMRGDAVC